MYDGFLGQVDLYSLTFIIFVYLYTKPMKPNFTISSAQANELLCKQFATWPFFATNYQTLDKVKEKCYSFDDFSIKVQFNPARTIMLRP